MSNHPSLRPTWTSAGNLRTVRLDLASGGVCLAAASPRRRCALTAPFQPCRAVLAHERGLRRCVFCGTFPRVSPGRRYRPPRPVMSGLSSKACAPAAARSARSKLAGRRGMAMEPHEAVRAAEDTPMTMYDVVYIDAHGDETPVAQQLGDRKDATEVARRPPPARGAGRLVLPGSHRLPNCVCVIPVPPADAV